MNNYSECKRCTYLNMSDEDYDRYIRRILAGMKPREKVNEDVYRARLASCSTCVHLQNGVCGMCGCFVELRAAGISSDCPMRKREW